MAVRCIILPKLVIGNATFYYITSLLKNFFFLNWGQFWAVLSILGTQSIGVFELVFLAMVFTVQYVGRVFGETTIYFMASLWENHHFLKILGYFGPFLAILMFFPCIILSSMTFSHQLSCFNIHNIQKIAFFAQTFTKWGPFWAPRFLNMFLAMVFTGICV